MISEKELNELNDFLEKENCLFFKDYVIKYETYFKTGGKIKFFLTPISIDQFKLVVNYLFKNKLDYKIIGFTSNLLLLDEVEYSIIISTKNLVKVEVEDNMVSVESGYALSNLVRVALMHQAKGFEGLEGIPASLGGAIFMNAGAYGHSVSDNLVSVDCIDENNNHVTLSKEECNFSYRTSVFKSGSYIILSGKFRLPKGDREEIARKIETYHIARHSYQDFVYPNLGSMISIPINLYQRILKNDKVYTMRYWFLKYIHKNPLMKLINRKKPNQLVFNKLQLKYLKSKKNIEFDYNMSIKSSNILINDGTVDTKEIMNYVFTTYHLLDKEYHIENEILIGPTVYSINDNFKETYHYISSELNQTK